MSRAGSMFAAAARALGERRLTRVLIEGGGEVAAAFLKADLVDRVTSYQAGLLLGADSRSAVGALALQRLDFAPRLTPSSTAADRRRRRAGNAGKRRPK